MQLVSMYVCVCVAPCVYGGGGGGGVIVVTLSVYGGGGGEGCYSSHFVCAYGEGVQTGCF